MEYAKDRKQERTKKMDLFRMFQQRECSFLPRQAGGEGGTGVHKPDIQSLISGSYIRDRIGSEVLSMTKACV